MQSRVEAYANQCLPDFYYSKSVETHLVFAVDRPHSDIEHVVCAIREDGGNSMPLYHLTEWSRLQLLSHLGTKEKWFEWVSKDVQAHELNIRLPLLHGRVFRTVRDEVDPNSRVVRGIVSNRYTDIPDTTILETLATLMPGAQVLKAISGQTQRALYVFAMRDEPFELPGTTFHGFPGVIIRNSEVGFTSLWAVPTLWFPHYRHPIVLAQEPLLRRTHRGTVDLAQELQDALQKAKATWDSQREKLRRLAEIVFPDEVTTLDAIRALILKCAGTARMSERVCSFYKAKHHHTHTGAGVLDAMLEHLQVEEDTDASYDAAAIAGAVLVNLLHL